MNQPPSRLAGPARARPSRGLAGRLRAPGDKSVSHRALILGALAEGVTAITGLLEGDDVLRTAAAVRALGAEVTSLGSGAWRVRGVGGRFASPDAPLDFGNSGTGCRLMMGAVAGAKATATFVGDTSLSGRPMERILAPLRAMGAHAEATEGHLPVTVRAPEASLAGVTWDNTLASAQVKSAILLAGLGAEGRVAVREPVPTRDHTERMLEAFGAHVVREPEPKGGLLVAIDGPVPLVGARVVVPSDPSSAAFLAAAALVTEDSRVELENVMANPTRTGFFRVLSAMNARAASGPEQADGESVCDWTIESPTAEQPLKPVAPDPAEAASMIDEYPLLAVLAAFADGESRFEGAAELRVKESDRIAATVAMLRVNGVNAEELPDGFIVRGRGPGSVPGGGQVKSCHDHRIAMSALVLGLGAREPVTVDDAAMIETSYPSFFEQMAALGAAVEHGR